MRAFLFGVNGHSESFERQGLNLYKHAVEVLRKTILPYVFGVQGLDIPYPAILISKDEFGSESGSVIFRLDERGLLIAEYFSYDGQVRDIWAVPESQSDVSRFIRLVDTGVEIPIRSVRSSTKTSTIYTQAKMPLIRAFECGISGWIGDSSAEMKSAIATLDGCAILPLLRSGEKTVRGIGEGENRFPSTAYYDSRITEVIELVAGGWKASLLSMGEDERENLGDEPPYLLSAELCGGSTFQLPAQSEVLRLVALLLSFSSERWVQYSTIYGQMPKARPHVARQAFIGRFASRGWSEKRDVRIEELQEWPVLFQGLWDSRDSPQMLSALTHLISCGDRSKDGIFSYQDLVEAGGALEAAVRLWNGLDPNHFFRTKGSSSLRSQLRQVVSEFRMDDRTLSSPEVLKIVRRAYEYRNTLAHGSGGQFHRSDNDEAKKVFAYQQYLYYLARLLVLVKLGGSSGHPGLRYYAPKLVPA